MARPFITTRPPGFREQKARKQAPRSRKPSAKAPISSDPCKFDVDTNTVIEAVSRQGEVNWTRVGRLARRFKDDAGLGTMIRTFIWATAKATRDDNMRDVAKLAKDTRRYQRYVCSRAGSTGVAKFKRGFPQRRL